MTQRLPLSSLAHDIFVGLADTRLRSEAGVRVSLVNVRHLRDGLLPGTHELDMRRVPSRAEAKRYEIEDRDVLVACRGTQPRLGLASTATAGAIVSANVIVVRSGERLLPEVLLAFLRSGEGQHALLTAGRSTTGLSLKPRDLARIEIPIPPIEHQHRLAELVQVSEQHHRAALEAAERRRAITQTVIERALERSSLGA